MMRIGQLRLREIRIPFTAAFRHASAERASTASLWAEVVSSEGVTGYGESCPRPYVTGETNESVRAFVAAHESSIRREVVDLESMRAWMEGHAAEVDRNPAAWCVVEIALLDLLAKERHQPVEALLSLPRLTGCFQYTAVVGDAEPDRFAQAVARYRRHGFTDFKIKLAGVPDRDRAKLGALADGAGLRVRVDANNLWPNADGAIRALRALESEVFAVEEPIPPNQYRDLARIAEALDCRIVLDESFIRVEQIPEIVGDPSRWLINVRVSKMGGILRSLRVVQRLREAGLGLIVGAQVGETSLLTRAALTVAHAGADLLVAQEGAFGTFLLAADVCEPALMFGVGGVLDVSSYPSLNEPGFGIVRSGPLNQQHFELVHP